MTKKCALTAAFIASAAVPAFAGDEAELNGQIVNNTLATAQAIAAGDFSPSSDADIFGNFPTATVRGRAGGGDVDFYSFFTPGGSARFDIDRTSGGFDSYLALFDATGTLLGDNDDSFPADPGSATDLDAFLGDISVPAGTYFIAVSSSGNAALATFTGDMFRELSRPDGAFGGYQFLNADAGDASYAFSGPQSGEAYTLHISVPAPGAAALLAGSVAFVFGRGRSRKPR
ncbi:MAG: DVUA0089 family protein [Phycisphaerales bacterium]